MGRIEGKVAIVTGAGSGIGKATALLFAQEGARVTVSDINIEGGEATVAEIKKAGGEAIFARTDVTKAADCKALVAKTVKTFGRLDIALNNAGVNQTPTPLADISEDQWDRLVDTHLKGVFLSMKYEIPEMLKVGGGAIVNTSSVGGLVANPGWAAYQAAKFGIIGISKVAALDYAKQNIRVNAICPGATRTAIMKRWIEEQPEIETLITNATPMGRMVDPIEQARAVLFLVSSDASFITGIALPVDGGYTAQ